MATPQPLLDLNTLLEERPPIRIDGSVYHLKSAEELTLAESHRFTAWAKRLEECGADEARIEELQELVETVARACVADVPADVFSKLSAMQHMSIVEVFTALRLGQRLRLAGAIVTQVAGRPTGANSSPGSSQSSGATSTVGSTASPLVS